MFYSETQRENFMVGRARFCNGPNREMPRCTALNRLGEPCKAARMRGQVDLLPPQRKAAAKRARLAAAHLSGDLDRIQRAEMRAERNRLRALWRRDPREPGRTIVLVAADEATCRAWAARQGFQLDLLDRDLPAFSDAMPVDLGADVARSDQRRRPHRQACATAQPDYGGKPCIRSFGMTMAGSFPWCGRNAGWRLPSNGAVTGPTASLRARKQRKARLATDAMGERAGSPGHSPSWKRPASRGRSVERWLDALDPREAFAARMFVKQVLQTLADDKARPAERFEARRELYRRLIAAGIVD